MAKPRRVTGLDPDKRLRPNAQRIIATRIDEVYEYDGVVADPGRVRELHDLRIACKRLRYLLEIFGVAFREDLGPYLDEVRQLQDILGEIHDCDVQVPMLEEHLRWLDEREAESAEALMGARATTRSPDDREEDLRRFTRRVKRSLRTGERVGVHALVARRRRERDELFRRFLEGWRRLKRERFRARLEAALDL